jgi:hypothetical protein
VAAGVGTILPISITGKSSFPFERFQAQAIEKSGSPHWSAIAIFFDLTGIRNWFFLVSVQFVWWSYH